MKVEDGLRVEGIKGSLDQELKSPNPLTLRPFNPATHFPSRTVHRLALVTAAATLLLLFIGGLVTSKGAALAVPDWPTTFGYNMFLYPWSKMIGNIFYEHSHRLVASGVGLLTLTLAFSLWFYEQRRWLCRLGVGALSLVIVQGIIGGLRVILLEETLAILHACLAQAFFALTVSMVFFTSKEWIEEPRRIQLPQAGLIQRLSILTTALIYLQVVIGAILRHTGAGIDIHLLLAAVVAIHIALLGARILRSHAHPTKFFSPSVLLVGLLILQIALGMGVYLVRFTPLGTVFSPLLVVILRTTHVVTGAMMLVTSLALTLRSFRFLALPEPPLRQKYLSEQLST